MTRSKRARRAFAMDAHFSLLAINGMHLDLGNVMCDLIHGAKADFLLVSIQRLDECLFRPMGNHLAIGKRIIDGATHRTQVPLSLC